MSIRTLIVVVFSLLALIVGLQMTDETYDAWRARRFADAVYENDRDGRDFIAATSSIARERGLTLIALAAADVDGVNLSAEIENARSATDTYGRAVMDRVNAGDGAASDIETYLRVSFSALLDMRSAVDNVLAAGVSRNHGLEDVWLLFSRPLRTV